MGAEPDVVCVMTCSNILILLMLFYNMIFFTFYIIIFYVYIIFIFHMF